MCSCLSQNEPEHDILKVHWTSLILTLPYLCATNSMWTLTSCFKNRAYNRCILCKQHLSWPQERYSLFSQGWLNLNWPYLPIYVSCRAGIVKRPKNIKILNVTFFDLKWLTSITGLCRYIITSCCKIRSLSIYCSAESCIWHSSSSVTDNKRLYNKGQVCSQGPL